ncbi:MAG: CoA transferase [Alphaproteobacteria bacterium]|nr:CoA transferase [Alphaproteobacteria bacterium]
MLTGQPLPLSGLKVLDLTTVIYGPYTTQMLGDFGADVIKIEAPGGDMTRDIGHGRNPKMTALFLGSNRNKRSLVLDLKRDAAKAALWRLIETADMLVHNIRPQKMAKLGFDPDSVLARNPTMIYGALLGYREDGPYGGMPAYDDVIQGQSGLAGTFTARDGEPVLMPTIVADKTAALLASNGLLAGVIRRLATGKGVYVETSMFEGLVGYTLLEHQDGAMFSPPLSAPGYARALSPERRPHRTADGYLCLLAYTDEQWRRFWDLIGAPEKALDPRFSSVSARADNIDALYRIAGEALATAETQSWLDRLRRAEIPAGPVNRLEDLRDDRHLRATGFFRPFAHPSEGDLEIPDTAFRFDREELPLRRPQPRLGEHGREVLEEVGLSADEIAQAFGGET